jgi:hypothetical protein
MEKVIALLKRVQNEVPATLSGVSAVLAVVLATLTSLPASASIAAVASALGFALVRAFVSPAFPADEKEALRLAERYSRLALEKMADAGDEVATAVLGR